jgi:hypothetical protein
VYASILVSVYIELQTISLNYYVLYYVKKSNYYYMINDKKVKQKLLGSFFDPHLRVRLVCTILVFFLGQDLLDF